MRIEVKENSKGAINLTNGKVPGLVPVYTGTNHSCSYYSSRFYNRENNLDTNLILEIKRKQ